MARRAVILTFVAALVFTAGAGAQPSDAQAPTDSSAAAAAKTKQVPVILGARIGEHSDRTRFVVEVSDPVKTRIFTLADPDRVVVDMPEVLWRLESAERPSGKGLVKSYRYGLFRPGNSRFVIDLNGPATVGDPMVMPPQDGYGYRIVFDLKPTTQTKFASAAGWPADLRSKNNVVVSTAPPESLPQPPAAKRIIVLDAGHGGIDSGTISPTGLQEKDLVLDEAKRVARALESRGTYIVHLTRDTDIYIPLRGRVDIGRSYKADLFVSLHADSNPDPNVFGASVYTLSEEGSDKEAAALAKKENQSDIIAGVDLSGEDDSVSSILIDLAQRDTMNRSSRFASAAVSSLGHATDILPRQPHRSAAFAVLKAPDVPAVLIELGYLSNASDSRQMATDRWRDSVAEAIAKAIDRHFAPQSAQMPAPTKTASE
jgi:N-acetylmuramoyl-L-alanine amidase